VTFLIISNFVAIASIFIAQSAIAADLTATGTYKLGSDPTVFLSDSGGYNVNVIGFPNSGLNSAILHSYGSYNGNFGSRSSGYGSYDVTGAFGIADTITNSSSSAQRVSFTFNIIPGMLQNELNSTLTGDQFVAAGIKFNLQRNGTSIWDSSATLSSNASGTTNNPTYYNIEGLTQTIDLGVLNAGESLNLRYDLSTFAKDNAPAGADRSIPEQTFVVPEQWVSFCNSEGYGGYGDEGYGGSSCTNELVPSTTVTIPSYSMPGRISGSHASSGDPFWFDTNSGITPQFSGYASALPPGAQYGVVFAPIPEPSTVALMLAGLGFLGGMARRHRSL
jgi:hypothetical protein